MLRSLLSNMSEGFAHCRVVLDAQGKPVDYVFLEVNSAFERLTGLAQVVGKRATQVAPGIEKDSTDWIGRYGNVALSGTPDRFKGYSQMAGKWYAVSAFSPEKGDVAVTVSDITKQEENASMLSKVQLEWERTFDSLPDLIAIMDEHHRVVRVNRAMSERLGCAQDQCVGLTCFRAVHGTHTPPKICPHALTLADGRPHTAELYDECLGGHFLVSTSPICTEEGKVVGSVHVSRNITSQKKAELALRQSHEALKEHTVRLTEVNRELEDFTYSVSHDLRAPLRAILGFTQMIQDENEAGFNPETRRKFGIIQSRATKMDRLIHDLLNLSRLGRTAMTFRPLDMSALARELLEEIHLNWPDVEFVADICELPEAWGDLTLVRQLLYNLLSNAVKFSRNAREARIEVGSFELDGQRGYYVKDNGVGFDMKYYHKLFGVFQRLVSEEQFEGTGAGLAIVQRIVQRHGGKVWAESESGQGASFFFTLAPRVHMDSENPDTTAWSFPDSPLSGDP
jgi:PAS domain S-box-containing protein